MPVTDIERPDDLTAEWLTAALGAGTVERFATERIGTGQMSECYRVELTYADGQTAPCSVNPGAGTTQAKKIDASDPKILTSVIGEKEFHLPVSKEHHGNWLEAIRDNKPTIAPVEEAHRACSACLRSDSCWVCAEISTAPINAWRYWPGNAA